MSEMPRSLHCQPVFSVANYALLWKCVEICINSANSSCMWSVFRLRSCRSCYIYITELQGRTLWCSQETWNSHLGVNIAVPVNHSHHIWSTANHLSFLTHSSQTFQLFGQQPSAACCAARWQMLLTTLQKAHSSQLSPLHRLPTPHRSQQAKHPTANWLLRCRKASFLSSS